MAEDQFQLKFAAERHIYKVSELSRRIRERLESEFSNVWVEGEISNLAAPSSGHWYLSIKDDTAQIRCAMSGHA